MEKLKFRKFDPEDTKAWAAMSQEQVNEFKRKVCMKCRHFGTPTSVKDTGVGNRDCNFLADEGYCRICSPLKCKEKGYFEPGARSRKKQIGKSIKYK